MSIRQTPTNAREWFIFLTGVSLYVIIIMIISGYVTIYNLQVVTVAGVPLDIGYGIPLASGLVLFVVTGAFMTWLKKAEPIKVQGVKKGRASPPRKGTSIDPRALFLSMSIIIVTFTLFLFVMLNAWRF